MERYPEARIEADFSNRVADLVAEGFDVAIRVGELEDSELSARRLGTVSHAFYVSPAYRDSRGMPETPDDLPGHPAIVFTPRGQAPIWRLELGDEIAVIQPKIRLLVNNNLAARDGVAAGLGIGLLPEFQAAPLVESGELVEVLHGWRRRLVPVHAVFVQSRYLAPTIRTFVDHATEVFDVKNSVVRDD